MPLFDYRCPSCGHLFEELVPRHDAEVRCPECGTAAEKRLSAFATAPPACGPAGCVLPGG